MDEDEDEELAVGGPLKQQLDYVLKTRVQAAAKIKLVLVSRDG